MAILDDFSLDYGTKKISHASGTTRYTVNALYSALMDLFDELGQLDDDVPMSAQTPTEYSMVNGWTFNADSDLGYLYGGSIKVSTVETWANFYTLGTIAAGTVMYVAQDGALVAANPGYTDGHIDMLVKVRAASADVDSRYVTVFARNLGDLYDHFRIQAPATGGRNPVPIATATDTNDDESGASVAGVTIAFGAATADVDGDSINENYDVTIDGGSNSAINVYRRLKYLTRRENTTAIDSPENTTTGRFYTAAGAYTEVKPAPFGTFAGGKFFGAQGVLVTNVSDPNNLQLIDAGGTTRTPPASITVSVAGVVSGDRVYVARTASLGGAIVKDQFSIASVTSNSITVVEAVPNDIATSGVIRVGDTRYTYSGLTRASKLFTGVSPDPTGSTGDCYVPIIDAQTSSTSEAKAFTYASDFTGVARVRKYGILPFEVHFTCTNAGATINAIRTTDSVVS